MDVRYSIESTPEGWLITEGGEIVATREDRGDALQVGRLLTLAAKAAGASATLRLKDEDGSGSVDPALL